MESEECLDRMVESVHHRLPVTKIPAGQPFARTLVELADCLSVVGDDEALHRQPLAGEHHEVARTRLRAFAVVYGDRATTRDASEIGHVRDGGLKLRAADVVEVHVVRSV